MNQDQLYRHTVSILKQLRIPFLDPCDETYSGDCLCGGGSNPTLQQVIDTQRGTDTSMEVLYYNSIQTVRDGFYGIRTPGQMVFNGSNSLSLTSGSNTIVESSGRLSLTGVTDTIYTSPDILIQASDVLNIANTGGPIALTGTELLFNGSPVGGSNQSLSISGYNLSISGGNTIPLPHQSLSLSGNSLSISEGNTVVLPDTSQTLSLSGNTLAISGGNSVSLASFVNTDAQTLSISGALLSISGGNTITIPTSAAQTLSLSGLDLSISGGNTITLPSGSAQNLSLGTATNTNQPINISGGTGVSLPSATTSVAGLMSGADKTKLDSLPSAVNLAVGIRSATEMPVTNSYGTGIIIPVATTLLAGLLSATDKVKLDGLTPGGTNLSTTNLTQTDNTRNYTFTGKTLNFLGGSAFVINADTLSLSHTANPAQVVSIPTRTPQGALAINDGTSFLRAINFDGTITGTGYRSINSLFATITKNLFDMYSEGTPDRITRRYQSLTPLTVTGNATSLIAGLNFQSSLLNMGFVGINNAQDVVLSGNSNAIVNGTSTSQLKVSTTTVIVEDDVITLSTPSGLVILDNIPDYLSSGDASALPTGALYSVSGVLHIR